MSFFKKVFKRKVGGTLVGNLFRGVGRAASQHFTGGLLPIGQGAMMLKPKEGEQVPEPTEAQQVALRYAEEGLKGGMDQFVNHTKGGRMLQEEGLKAWLSKNAGFIVAGAMGTLFAIFAVVRMASSGGGRRY